VEHRVGWNIVADGRCAGAVTDELLVLACAMPAGHDEGFRQSRLLAQQFCDRAVEAAAVLDDELLVAIARTLLSKQPWIDWHLSFCMARRVNGRLQAFNCGITGLLRIAGSSFLCPLLVPQTLGAKLRGEGVASVPPYVAAVAATLAGKDLATTELATALLDDREPANLIAVADPCFFDALQAEVMDDYSTPALRAVVARAASALKSAESSFIVWAG
jgi:hypothetical protein